MKKLEDTDERKKERNFQAWQKTSLQRGGETQLREP